MTIEEIISKAQSAIDGLLTPEVMEMMNDEQKKQIEQAKNSLTLGDTFEEKMEQLKKLNDITNGVKNN
jgi:predicted RNase H-like HicB family nuclease